MRRKNRTKFYMVLFILLLSLFSAASVSGAERPAAMERGEKLIYPADLGEHFTYYYQVNQKPAYCLQSSVKSPESGNYTGSILEENEDLRQVLYYGYGGPGDISTQFYPEYSNEVRYILTHLAASYIYCGDAALKGCTEIGMEQYRVMAYIAALLEKKIPEGSLYFSCENQNCFRTGNVQRTQAVQLNGPPGRTATVKLPQGVSLRFMGSEETAVSGEAQIKSRDSFYLEFPLDAKGEFKLAASAVTPKNDWKLVILTTGEKTQDIGYGEYIPGGQESFDITFLRREYYPSLVIAKTDAWDGAAVCGAEFVLKDEKGNLVERWISTDKPYRLDAVKPGNYLLEEISAPIGYLCMKPQWIKVTAGVPRITVKAENKRLHGKIIIQKRDKDSRQLLSGVQFAVLKKDTQEVLEIMETDEKGIAQSSPLPIWKYENGTAKEKITYLIREIRPADGYQKPKEDVEADCTQGKVIVDIQELYMEWDNERIKETPTPTPALSPSPSPASTAVPTPSPSPLPQKAPKTGDENSWTGYCILMIFMLSSAAFLVNKRHDFI